MRNYSKVFAENVRRRLAEIDRRPAWLAKKAGITSSLVSRLLSDDGGNPSLSTIASIAQALDLEVDDLLLPNDVPEDLNRWGSVEALESDLKSLFAKLSKLQLQVSEETDAEGIKQLLRSKETVENEMEYIHSRIKFLKQEKPVGSPKAAAKKSPPILGRVAVDDVLTQLRLATPAQQAMTLTILFQDPSYLSDFELPQDLLASLTKLLKSGSEP